MIVFNLFAGTELHPSPHYQNQERSVGEALAEVVRVLSDEGRYGCWVEDYKYGEVSMVKVGSYGMAGARWIYTFEGPIDEIRPLVEVCYWFHKAGGKASDEFKAKLRVRERVAAIRAAPLSFG